MQQNDSPYKIIAVNPGSRYLAIAVFDSAKLSEWRLKNMHGEVAKHKLVKAKKILAAFVERYSPNILVIKKLHPARSSAMLQAMAIGIIAYCRRQGMSVFSYSIQDLKSALAGSVKINKRELSKILAGEYPELSNELKREQRNRNSYFTRLFEAVALGHVCLNAIGNNH